MLPSILPLALSFKGFSELISLVRTVAVVPLMPRPLAEVMVPVFKIVLLPAPRFSAAWSPVPVLDVPPVMSPLLVKATVNALTPCWPPEIVPAFSSVFIAPVI